MTGVTHMAQDLEGRPTSGTVRRVTRGPERSAKVSVGCGKGFAVTMALLLTGCALGDVTGSREGLPHVPTFSHTPFATGFWQYPLNQLLHEADWTRIAWWSSGGHPILRDWRVKSVPGSLGGRAVQLENPPLDAHYQAIRWDALPTLGPPLDILTHLWIPPATNHPRVGIAWFIGEPDATGRLKSYALVRNPFGSVDNGFSIVRFYNEVTTGNPVAGYWPATQNDGLEAGGWAWIRVHHTTSGDQGTIRFRVWQGAREDEPPQWDAQQTSTFFGPGGDEGGSGLGGRAGLLAAGSQNMANAALYWDLFAVGDDPDGCTDEEIRTMIAEYETFEVDLRPTCGDFANTGGTTHFSWSELNGGWAQGNPHQPWGMVRLALTNGLEATRTNYNRGGIRLTSGYRCPHGNDAVGGEPLSRHMHGQAADMYSADHPWTEQEFNLLRRAAARTRPRPFELLFWESYPEDRHLHAAWRPARRR
jgi:hypothetical protein